MLFNTGCDDYLDVNKNVDSPDYVEDYLYLSGILQTYQDVTWDFNICYSAYDFHVEFYTEFIWFQLW